MTNEHPITTIDRHVDRILANPEFWGGADAIEPVVLALMTLRGEIDDGERGLARVQQLHTRHLSMLTEGNLDPLVARLRVFVAAVRA